MAGAGYKLFNTGDVLTAAQVNTYLMEQTVMVFANAAARTTALSGVVSEGMISYLKDTNAVEVYDGSNWVSSDDPNAIQNTIVDAKGDLIAATANDTPARLAVGANDTLLVADSTTATGLKWAGAWQSWTPTYGSLTVGNGVTVARYVQIGKTVHWYLKFTLGSTTVFSQPSFTLPITPANPADQNIPMLMRDSGVAWYFGSAIQEGGTVYTNAINTSGTYAQPSISSTIPFTWGTNDFFTAQGSYEAS